MSTNNMTAAIGTTSDATKASAPARAIPRAHQPFWEILAAIFLALIAHHTVIHGSFHQDDEAIINAANIKAKAWEAEKAKGRFAWEYLRERPLYYFTLVVNHRLGSDPQGKDIPFGFHLFNLIGHLLAVAGLYVLVASLQMRSHQLLRQHGLNRDALAPGWGATASYLPLYAAVLFAVHPLATEPVAYVMARANGWGGALFLWSWAFCVKALTPRVRLGRAEGSVLRIVLLVIASLFLLFLSWGFKETHALMVIVFPISLWLATPAAVRAKVREQRRASKKGEDQETEDAKQSNEDGGLATGLKRRPWLAFGAVVFVFLVLGLAYGLLKVSQPLVERVFYDFPFDPEIALPSQSAIVLWNWGRALVPYYVSLEYDHPFRELNDPVFWATLAGHVALVVAAWFLGRRRPWMRIGVVMYYITLAPTNSFLLRFDLWSDRNAYLACAAACVIIAGLFQELALRTRTVDLYARPVFSGRGWAAVALFVIWIGAFTYLSHKRDKLYSNPEAFWADTVAKAPNHPRAHLQYAYILDSVDKLEPAKYHYQRTVDLIDAVEYFGHSHWALWRSLAETRLAHFDIERAMKGDEDYLYDAEERLYMAFRDNPTDPAPLRELIKLHFYMKELDSVEEDLEEALEDGSPLNAKEELQFRIQLLRRYLLRKDPKGALRALNDIKAVKLPLSKKEENKLREEIRIVRQQVEFQGSGG